MRSNRTKHAKTPQFSGCGIFSYRANFSAASSRILYFRIFPAAFIGYLVMFVHYPVVQRFVINPYYEESGERNPEEEEEIPEEDRVFTDRGGTEQPVKVERKKGKVIS